MEDWIAARKIPLGTWMSDGVDLLNQNAQSFFDALSASLSFLINGLTQSLLLVPPLLLIVLLTGAVYALHRSWKLSLFVVLSLLLVTNLGYWRATTETPSPLLLPPP